MGVTSKCNYCGVTSLDVVLQHSPSCNAAKPEVQWGNAAPSTTLMFDTPEDQKKFAANLMGSAGSNVPVSNPQTPATADERLNKILLTLGGSFSHGNTEYNNVGEDLSNAKQAINQLLFDKIKNWTEDMSGCKGYEPERDSRRCLWCGASETAMEHNIARLLSKAKQELGINE